MRISHLYQLLTESILLESYNQLNIIFDIDNVPLEYRREFETLSVKNGFNNMTVPEVFEYLVKKEPHIFRGEDVSENEFRKLVNVQFWISQFRKDPTVMTPFVIVINRRLEDRLKRVAQKSQESDYEVLLKTPEYILYKPNSEAASCKLGKGTKWCTAATQGTNHFNEYRDQGELYYIHTRLPHPFDKIAIFVYNSGNHPMFDSEDNMREKSEFIRMLGYENMSTILEKIGLGNTGTITYPDYANGRASLNDLLLAIKDNADEALMVSAIYGYTQIFNEILEYEGVNVLSDVIMQVESSDSYDNSYKEFFRNNRHKEGVLIDIGRILHDSDVDEDSPREEQLRLLQEVRIEIVTKVIESYISQSEGIFELEEAIKDKGGRGILSNMSDLYDETFDWGDDILYIIESLDIAPSNLRKSKVLSFIHYYDFQAKLDVENAYRELS